MRSKKLEAAGRFWAIGGENHDDAIEDLKKFGAPQEVIDQMQESRKAGDFEVFEENMPALEMFLRLQTQWRTSFGGLIGLDYQAAKWMFELYDVTKPREMLESISLIERGALVALAEDKKHGS